MPRRRALSRRHLRRREWLAAHRPQRGIRADTDPGVLVSSKLRQVQVRSERVQTALNTHVVEAHPSNQRNRRYVPVEQAGRRALLLPAALLLLPAGFLLLGLLLGLAAAAVARGCLVPAASILVVVVVFVFFVLVCGVRGTGTGLRGIACGLVRFGIVIRSLGFHLSLGASSGLFRGGFPLQAFKLRQLRRPHPFLLQRRELRGGGRGFRLLLRGFP